jgi:hypothetical protein
MCLTLITCIIECGAWSWAAERVISQQKRVNVDFPVWMIHSLDRETHRLGVTRQSVITLVHQIIEIRLDAVKLRR